MIFENPANGHRETANFAFLWCLLFGCFYFAVKGAWGHAAVAFVLACLTFSLSWLIYPFFAKRIVRTTYLRKGWRPVNEPLSRAVVRSFTGT
jgi:hypothetical protein